MLIKPLNENKIFLRGFIIDQKFQIELVILTVIHTLSERNESQIYCGNKINDVEKFKGIRDEHGEKYTTHDIYTLTKETFRRDQILFEILKQ